MVQILWNGSTYMIRRKKKEKRVQIFETQTRHKDIVNCGNNNTEQTSQSV
jgi:hypothetical protein